MQVTLFESQTWEELGRSLDRMREAGANTLFFRVFQNRGDRPHGFIRGTAPVGVYFRTRRAPVVEDVLDRVCAMAHQRGLKIFAWMTTRRCDWLSRERPDLRGWSYDPETGSLLREEGLDLFDPEVFSYLQGLYRDLARYPVDGILFQDDLVLRHTEGFGPKAEALYRESTGGALTPARLFRMHEGRVLYAPGFWNIARWKNRRILAVIHGLVAAVAAERSGVRWVLNGYYESVTDPENALAWYAQDLRAALAHGIDYIAVMAYHRQIMEELGISYSGVLSLLTDLTRRAAALAGDPDRVLIKVQTLNWHTEEPLPPSEIRKVLEAVKAGGGTGIVYVRGRRPPCLTPIREGFSRPVRK